MRWVPLEQRCDRKSPRLLCFPYAGGSPLIFKDWGKQLEISVLSADRINPEIFGFNKTDARALSDFADVLVEQLDDFDFSQPYITFGHSLGALKSFEFIKSVITKELNPPVHAIFSAMEAPHLRSERSVDRSKMMMSDADFLLMLKSFNGTPENILDDPEMVARLLPMIKADFSLLWSYQVDSHEEFDFPISVFYGVEDKLTSFEGVWPWNRYSKSCFMRAFSGGHFYINDCAEALFAELKKIINQYLN